jgi:hypothetical protein
MLQGAGLLALLLAVAIAGCAANTTTPEPTAKPAFTPTLTPSAIPTDIATASASASPTPTPTATPIPRPATTLSPSQRAANDKVYASLAQWIHEKGNAGIPTSKLWTEFGKKQSLSLGMASRDAANQSSVELSQNNWTPTYFTLDVGTIVLNDENGNPHLVLPLLQVDGVGNHYYVFMNLGPMDDTFCCVVSLYASRNGFQGQPDRNFEMITAQFQTALDGLRGDVFELFYIYADESFPEQYAHLAGAKELISAKPINRELASFALKAGLGDYHALLGEFPNVAKLVNADPPQVDAIAIPFAGAFGLASVPAALIPKPTAKPTAALPQTLTSTDPVGSLSMVLPPGTFAVSYRITGTCTANAYLSATNRPVIPIAADQVVDSQEFDGTATVTTPALDTYSLYVDAGDCSWSFTFGPPL